MSHSRLTPLAAGLLLLAAVAPPAVAQTMVLRPGFVTDPTDPTKIVRTAVVTLSDIEVTSTSGAQTLLERIEAAADAVCGGRANAVSQREKEGYIDCHRAAVAAAVAKMRSPVLTTLASNRRQDLVR
ncbi:MAG: UrcA family protein [Phenylobacterium sp.]